MNSAQTPINKPTKTELNFENKKILKLSKDSINYNINLSYNEKLILFEVEKEDKNEFPKKDFKLYLDLEQLTKLDKYFSQFESVSEIPFSFETLLGMKKIDIIYGDKESKIKIINPLNKKEFYISIPLKEKSQKNEIDAIIPYIISLNDKINKMENRINLLEKTVNDLILFNNSKEKKLFPESNIIKLEDEKIILSWFDKKPSKFNLLLDMKKDGDSINTFDQKCGNKAPTILFFKTNSGARFGGYTTQFWPTDGYKKDENSFVFSLNKKEKYKVIKKNTSYAIVGRQDYYQFGSCCFRIYDKCSSTNKNFINKLKDYYDIPDNFGLTDGENKFIISTYEVYQIEF